MVKTALYDKHLTLKGKMVDFHGFEMPLQYEAGIIDEHLHVRRSVGVFDVSHMGDLLIVDRDQRADFLNSRLCFTANEQNKKTGE